MNLDAARKRHGKKTRRTITMVKAVAQPPAEINVTPLVDVVLVLLIIFMVMTPMAEKVLNIKLTAQASGSDTKPAPSEQLIVTLHAHGIRINGDEVSSAQYEPQLAQRLSQRADSERTVFVVAEEGVSYATLVDSIALAKRAGAVTVGVVP